MKKRSCGGIVVPSSSANSTLTAEYGREARSKSFSVLEDNKDNTAVISSSGHSGTHPSIATAADCSEVASPRYALRLVN
jgi:hypothetical protein